MWSSTSDNKKQEEIDDCSCSGSISNSNTAGVGSSSTAVAAALATPKQQQQQKLNTFDNTATTSGSSSSSSFSENNSNISIKPFGGNNSSDQQHKQKQELKEKDFDNAASLETGDSGFISGPQTHSCELDVDDFTTGAEKSGQQGSGSGFGGAIRKTVNKQLLNIAAAEYEDEKTILDSGCIDEDLEEYDEEYGDEQKKQKEKQKNREELQQEQEHEATKQAASYLAGSAIATAAAATATATGTGTENQMILKQNVDAGMSEWFCNLSLQNTPATTTQQQQSIQQQQSVAGTAMNNLDSTSAVVAGTAGTAGSGIGIGRRSATIAGSMVNSQQQQQSRQHQQQQAAGNSATTTQQSTSTTNLTPSNAWEQFYQQNDDGDTPLHLACISGYVDVVAALIRMAPHPCLFNIQNDEAQTPLHLAALTAQPKILRMLLIAGAEPTLRDRHGNTALHLVCVSGEEQCVRALTIPISASEINEGHRQYGHRSNDKTVSYLSCARLPSDFEIRNYDGERCVHLAAQAGHIDVLRILVLYGADINAREGKSGRTPLHIAIECCNEDLANFLLDECLKLNLETATYAGLTAYQVACIHEKTQMQNILEKRGAEPLTPPDSDYDSSDIESDLDDSKMYDRFGDPGYFISYNGGNPMTVA